MVTVSAQCADVIPFGISGGTPTGSPSGTLSCNQQPDNLGGGGTFLAVTDFLGIPSIPACNSKFGSTNDILFFQVTLSGQTCSQVTNSPTGLKLGALTSLTDEYCHSAGEVDPETGFPLFDCATKSGKSVINNVAETACVANPQTLNTDCRPNKDSGVIKVCYVTGQKDVFSFDPNELDPNKVTLNGVAVKRDKNDQPLCVITDCNRDGQLDFQCTFPTCVGTSIAPDGELTMATNFLNVEDNTGGGLSCTTNVKTTGK